MIEHYRNREQNNAYLYKLLPNGEITTLYGIIGHSGVSTFFIYLTAIGNYKVKYVSDFPYKIDNNDTIWSRENDLDLVKHLFMDKIKEDIKCKKSIIKTKKIIIKKYS